MKTFSVPILILAWRRPEALSLVINAIRPLKPNLLYVACDGPNHQRLGEVEKVEATRNVIDKEIDWPCKVNKLYSDSNQGCQLGVSNAISWFFENVEEGIILEDDCVPHPDFFSYCALLLDKYRVDERVWCISGSNFQNGRFRGDGSYYFSRYNHCWGWASWRRCWQKYDNSLSQWPALQKSGALDNIFEDSHEKQYWSRIWQKLIDENKPDSWAYRWTFACLINGGLTALPNNNLIRNIGFGKDATNTAGSRFKTSIGKGIDASLHPSFLLRDVAANRYTFNHHFRGKFYKFPFSIIRFPVSVVRRIYAKLTKILC